MADCCPPEKNEHSQHDHHKKARPDYLLWASGGILLAGYLTHIFLQDQISSISQLQTFSQSVFDLLNRMSWGIALGILFVGILEKIPRNFIAALMGKGGTLNGILRATAGGILLDLCSHGVLLVGMKLYQRGLSLGQTMAFLIASPWNSISLTLILWALVGLKWTLAFLLLSMAIAIISGLIFDQLVKRGVLAKNPNTIDLPSDYSFKKEFKNLKKVPWNKPTYYLSILKDGLFGSTMILRWIFFGTVLAALIRAFISPDQFETLFGPTLAGLGLTLIIATVLEVCSEGSTPIAADILTRANAPGNAFAFLMTGVSTDYTEILSLKETTKSWKTALFLPLVTVPQVVLLAIIMNGF